MTMAFRRSNSFRRQPTSFRSRSRFRPTGTDRKTKPTQRYEWGEFFNENLDQLPEAGGAPGDTSVFFMQLATTRTLGDPSEPQGRTLINAARHLDIGGVVIDYSIDPTAILGDVFIGAGIMYVMVGLVVDRLLDDGSPVSVASWDPFESGTPAVQTSGTAPTADTLDIDRPRRLLWQKTWRMDYAARTINNVVGGTLYVPSDQRVETRHPTLNKRLKARLDDDLGLYFIRAYRATAAFDLGEATPSANFWARGSIYYRYAF